MKEGERGLTSRIIVLAFHFIWCLLVSGELERSLLWITTWRWRAQVSEFAFFEIRDVDKNMYH